MELKYLMYSLLIIYNTYERRQSDYYVCDIKITILNVKKILIFIFIRQIYSILALFTIYSSFFVISIASNE